MLLKIFVKRKAHGELCTDDYEYSEQFIEADEILKAEINPNLKTRGFRFALKNFDGKEIAEAYCALDTHGFEIRDSNGNVVDRYITKIDD